jgi:UDP-N-acetylenolpyruvoylglucosamine reductase
MTNAMAMMSRTTCAALDGLADLLPGRVTRPADEQWDAVRLGWSLLTDQHPVAVVAVREEDDVVSAIRYCSRHGLRVSVQPVGHGATTKLTGTVLLRTRALRGITVDPVRRTARVGAGVKWAELLAATSDYGLTGLAGSSGDPTVVGFTVGGGVSWFSRQYGLAAHSVIAFDIVDARGDRRQVSDTEDPELFWALRGGGGDFAVILQMEFSLQPIPTLIGGRLLWPIEWARPVLQAFESVTRTAPDELTLWTQLLRFPPIPEVPEPLRGGAFIAIDVTYNGAAVDAELYLAPFREIPVLMMDTVTTMAIRDLPSIAAEPVDPIPSIEYSQLVDNLDAETISALLDIAGPASDSPLLVVQLRHLGGALRRGTEIEGPAGSIDEPYQLFCAGAPLTPEAGASIEIALAESRVALQQWLSDRTLFNFLLADGDPTRAFSRTSLGRLQHIKRFVDPEGVFVSNRPVITGRPSSCS